MQDERRAQALTRQTRLVDRLTRKICVLSVRKWLWMVLSSWRTRVAAKASVQPLLQRHAARRSTCITRRCFVTWQERASVRCAVYRVVDEHVRRARVRQVSSLLRTWYDVAAESLHARRKARYLGLMSSILERRLNMQVWSPR